MSDKEILANAPKDEVMHVDSDGDSDIWHWDYSGYGGRLAHYGTPRSLADIQRIVELEEEVKRLQAENTALTKDCSDIEEDLIETQKDLSRVEIKLEEIELFFTDEDACPIIEPLNSKGLDSWLKSNNLKQQAKGIEDAKEEIIMRDIYHSAPDVLQGMANKLRNQAKELK